MTTNSATRRRSPPIIVWIILCILPVAAAAAVVLGMLAWQEAQQVEALKGEVDTLRQERQVMASQIVQLEGTATVLGNRLVTLEENDPAQQLATLQAQLEATNDSQQIADLQASLAEIQTRVNTFQNTMDELAVQMEALAYPDIAQESLPPSFQIEVARQRQSHNLSCESSAASMVAQYHGVNASEAEILAAFPLSDNPHQGFRGNVDGPTGGIQDYGVYAGPVLRALRDRGLRAWPVAGGLEGIKSAIARGNPVIAWVTYDCQASTPVEAAIDGETVTLVPNQHVVVVTGYDATGVWANDPWDGQQDFYSNAVFEQAMSYFDNMAIEVAGP